MSQWYKPASSFIYVTDCVICQNLQAPFWPHLTFHVGYSHYSLSVRRVRVGQGYRWSTAFAVRTTRRCIHPLIHTLGKFRAANPLTGVCLGSEGKPENLGNSTQTVNWTQDRTREPWSCATHSYNCITLLTIPHPSSTYAEMTHTERKGKKSWSLWACCRATNANCCPLTHWIPFSINRPLSVHCLPHWGGDE